MRTQRQLHTKVSVVYSCELENCPICDTVLKRRQYLNGRKTVQTMSQTMQIAYSPKWCPAESCKGYQESLKSAEWQQLAPLYGTYGYDVIGTIGWQRQTLHQTFDEIHQELASQVQISASQVRHLYTYHYLPLLACQERDSWEELEKISEKKGLILTLDGLAPEGGEAQLWLVRELRTGKTIRSGWMSEQGQTAFENFLEPIVAAGLRIEAVMSDKQRGLVPAVASVFPQARHGYCQSHYLNNLAEPVAKADEGLKVRLRQQVREEIGELVRAEQVEQAGVLTVTGLLPTPLDEDKQADVSSKLGQNKPLSAVEAEESEGVVSKNDLAQQVQPEIESAIRRRIRYLLTLKGRPPFRLAGIEMYERLSEVSANLAEMITHLPTPCLGQLQHGLKQSLTMVQSEYLDLSQAAGWLHQISDLLAPEDKAPRTGEQVQTALLNYLDLIERQSQDNTLLAGFAQQIKKTTHSYQSGLFHTYDIPDLPRTNNDRESEFRGLNQHLLRTTGQKGGARRLIQRSGAWELIPRPDSLTETVEAISTVDPGEYKKERARVRSHRDRFRFHTRSVNRSKKQLQDLKERWLQLPSGSNPW